ncbi:tetratricopeptide repeat protein [Methanomethylophilus alvi]|uniref:tetratricopeptide repeat protein n=1 Tax=Methanomethylophilus alvi TaxID=1291540 RepID=UPI0037DD6574
MGNQKVIIDILGVCTTRDIFGFNPQYPFDICKYYQVSLIPLFNSKKYHKINITTDDIVGNNGFEKKCCCAELNGSILEDYFNSGAEWILLDFRSIPKGVYKVVVNDTAYYYSQGHIVKKEHIIKYWLKQGITINQTDIETIEFEKIPNCEQYLKDLCKFLRKRYSSKIILIDLRSGMFELAPDGEVKSYQNYFLENSNYLMGKYFIWFLQKLNCHYVKIPTNVICDTLNKWGPGDVHYVSEYYTYAIKAIVLITSGSNNLLKKLDMLYIEYNSIFDSIRSKKIFSIHNILQQIDNNLIGCKSEKDYSKHIDFINDKITHSDDKHIIGELYAKLGKTYRDVTQLRNFSLSAEYFKKSFDEGISWALDEYLKILWRINSVESLDKYILTINQYVSEYPALKAYLSKALFEGKGIEKNINQAIKLAYEAISLGVDWIRPDLFDYLWCVGTQDAYDKMIVVIAPPFLYSNGAAMFRMGKAYHMGYGVDKNLFTAAEWLRKGANKGIIESRLELFDVLKEINTPESLQEIFDTDYLLSKSGDTVAIMRLIRDYQLGCGTQVNFAEAEVWKQKLYSCGIDYKLELLKKTPHSPEIDTKLVQANSGNGNAMGAIGRAYRDGVGVSKDLVQAADWMNSAAKHNVGWAKNELFDICWALNNEYLDKIMFNQIYDFAKEGNGNAMGRLGKAYYYGRGIEKNIKTLTLQRGV